MITKKRQSRNLNKGKNNARVGHEIGGRAVKTMHEIGAMLYI